MTQIASLPAKRVETPWLLQKATVHLSKIGTYFAENHQDLPAEIQRDAKSVDNEAQLFPLLDLHLRQGNLDQYLYTHASCLEMVMFLFGSRYPSLIRDQELRAVLVAADGTSSNETQKILSTKRPKYQQEDSGECYWSPQLRYRKDKTEVPLKEAERRALEAFRDFQTTSDDPRIPPSARGKFLTRPQLDAFEKGLHGMMAGSDDILVGAFLSFILPPAPPAPDAPVLSPDKGKDIDKSFTSDTTQYTSMSDVIHHSPTCNTNVSPQTENNMEQVRFMEYKGYLVEPPPSMLRQIKAYLQNPNLEQRTDWVKTQTDMQQYLSYLVQIRVEESWAAELEDVLRMFRGIALFEDFHKENSGLDHAQWADVMVPKYTLQRPILPLTPAVDIKQLLPEKRDDTPSPLEEEALEEEGPILDNMIINDAPAEGARDPFAYTRWHKRLKANLAVAREHARDKTLGQMKKQQPTGDEAVLMELPKNWNGPVVAQTIMDTEMSKTACDHKRLQLLCQALRRASRRSPRVLLQKVIKFLERGLNSKHSGSVGVDFHASEYKSQANDTFVRLGNDELKWLDFICQPSLNGKHTYHGLDEVNEEDWKMTILRKRVRGMLWSLVPGSFGDGQRLDTDAFLEQVNQDCGGQVQRYRFSLGDLNERLEELKRRKIVQTTIENGTMYIQRFAGEVHPEDAIRWPRSNLKRKWIEDDDPDEIISAKPDAPRVLPEMDDLRPVEECLQHPRDIAKEASKTSAFFCRLAYRLGRTMHDVDGAFRDDLRLLRDPRRQKSNRDSLDALLRQWSEDAAEAPVPQCRNGRTIATYRDVVAAADQDALEGVEGSEKEVEEHCKDLVRKNIIREAADNKPMLWPLPVPRDSDVGPVLAKDGRTVLRREAVWSFAHPSRRRLVPRFMDINRWPIEPSQDQ